MRLIFLGPPGAGKGTQARELEREWGTPQIATGEMLRQAVSANTMLGRDAKGFMDRGQLVSDAVIIGLIAERLEEADTKHGFILDGFPRTITQAEGLDRLLKNLDQTLDAVVYFEISEPELLRRLTDRRVCRKCQATYHLVSAPPKREGICDGCGGALYQREDDSEATVRNRLAVYARQTAPLLDHYRGRGLLVTVPGEGGMDEVREAIRRATRKVER